jgi:DNA polymerase III sliding clamp (beta) subunit (PCNA family)
MKFQISGDVFKKAVDRVMAMIPNKAAIYDLECVRLVSGRNEVEIIGFDTECYCSVTVPALVMEDGEAVVHKDDLKKVYTIKNNLLVVSEQEMFTVSNGKKKSTTKANIHYNVDDYFDMDFCKDGDNKVLEMPDSKLLEVLTRVNAYTAHSDDPNILMRAIHFDSEDRKVVGIDSHRIGLFEDINESYFAGNNITANVPNVIVAHMKKLLMKDGSYVEMYANKKLSAFIGEDFTYCIRNYAGEYFDYKRFANGVEFRKFYVNRKELAEVSKEYSKLTKSEKKAMFMGYNNRAFTTAIFVSGYSTSDVIDTEDAEEIGDGFVIGVNPEFINDAMNGLDSEMVTMGFTNNKSPIIVSDGEYTGYVLPVNISGMEIDNYIGYTAA